MRFMVIVKANNKTRKQAPRQQRMLTEMGSSTKGSLKQA